MPLVSLDQSLVTNVLTTVATDVLDAHSGSLEVESVVVPTVTLLSAIDVVDPGRLRGAKRIWRKYGEAGLPRFVSVLDSNEAVHLGVLAERTPSGIMILDGVHRCLANLRAGTTMTSVLLIDRTPRVPPPCDLLELDRVEFNSDPHPAHKFIGASKELFRPGSAIVDKTVSIIQKKGADIDGF